MLLWLSMVACMSPETVDWPALGSSPPLAGAAEGTLDLPVGTPMGGFSARAKYLGGVGKADLRQSPYAEGFVPSAGVHMRPGIKVIWLQNEDQDLVLTETDTIYSYDGLVDALTAELEARTGRNLKGKVTHSTNHSHNSYGPFSDQPHFYLGGDKFNREIFDRFVGQVVTVAMAAHERLQPAAIGSGWAEFWDPNDRVYHDRRSVNDDLQVWEDLPPGGFGKDPTLHVLRVDAADGTPIAFTHTFGIHGTVMGEEASMISGDASQGIDMALQEEFDSPVVVMHLPGAGGDASPSGVDHGMARVESLGEFARDAILQLYTDTPTSTDPIRMETDSRHIWENRDDIRVTRNGSVDWHYAPFEKDYQSDEVIYDANGDIQSPLDEFNAEFGAVFCGSDAPLIPAGYIGSSTYPYSTCVDLGLASRIVKAIFEVDEADMALPLKEDMKAGTAATRVGPLPTRLASGTSTSQDLYAAFFPAEPTYMFAEQFRRRASAELGYANPLLVGYSQDHEGYFLIAEDWLRGGYEPNIASWGPLQGEHVMEGVFDYSKRYLSTTDVVEDADPDGYYASPAYPERPMPTEWTPDLTPNAGERILTPPAYLYTPEEIVVDLSVPTKVSRVQGAVQIAWYGGDAMVDLPRVVLEREQPDGSFAAVKTASGREVNDNFTDILETWTPTPLFPPEAEQTHLWWASWQAVGHMRDRVDFPLGNYRLHVFGQRWVGGDTAWPWTTEAYDWATEPFEVVGATIRVDEAADGVWLSIPADGWRLIDVEGQSRGDNPVRKSVTLSVNGGAPQAAVVDRVEGGRSHVAIDLAGVSSVEVVDAAGNSGELVR